MGSKSICSKFSQEKKLQIVTNPNAKYMITQQKQRPDYQLLDPSNFNISKSKSLIFYIRGPLSVTKYLNPDILLSQNKSNHFKTKTYFVLYFFIIYTLLLILFLLFHSREEIGFKVIFQKPCETPKLISYKKKIIDGNLHINYNHLVHIFGPIHLEILSSIILPGSTDISNKSTKLYPSSNFHEGLNQIREKTILF